MTDAARLRAQKSFSTDPGYLERMARHEEARDVDPPRQQPERTPAAEDARPGQ